MSKAATKQEFPEQESPEQESPRAKAKRRQITQAAQFLFLTQGYARTSMDAVTQTAGISKQTLYVYFRSKTKVLEAVICEELATLKEHENSPSPKTLEEFRSKLLTLASSITGELMQEEAVALLRLLIGEAIHIPELRSSLRETFPAQLLHSAQTMIRSAHSEGLIAAPQADLSARMFVGPLMSFVMLDGFFGSELPTPPQLSTLEAIVDAFLLTVKKGD